MENSGDFVIAGSGTADSYKTTALPIELGRRRFLLILARTEAQPDDDEKLLLEVAIDPAPESLDNSLNA